MRPTDVLLRQVHQLARAQCTDVPPDRDLLHRFAVARDEDAFATLVRRHGAMVLRVCRRVLQNDHDAEDAFQATFLVLARKAASPGWHETIGNWLYGVATRVSLEARTSLLRRRAREGQGPVRTERDPAAEVSLRDGQLALHEELARLPERLRRPVELCYLEGRTRDQAARELLCSVPTLDRRLGKARALLRVRLARRGVILSTALLAAGLTENAAGAGVGGWLVGPTVRAAAAVAAGRRVVGEGVSSEAAGLADGFFRTLFLSRIRKLLVLLGLTLLLATGGVLARKLSVAKPADPRPADPPGRPDQPARVDGHGDPLPDGAVARLGTVRFRTRGLLYSAVLAPDGKTVAAGSADGAVHLFDATTGQPLRRLDDGARFHITCLAYAPDGRTLAAGVYPNRIAIWDLATGKAVRFFPVAPGPGGPLWSLAFTRDGTGLLAAGGEGPLRLLDPATGKERRRFAGHKYGVRSMALSPDGRIVASGAGAIRLWDLATGQALHRLTGPKDSVRALAFSPDGTLLAAGGEDGAVWLWEASSGKLRRRLPEDVRQAIPSGAGCLHAIAFSPDGKTLAAGHANYGLRLWNVATGRNLWGQRGIGSVTYTSLHDGGIQTLLFSPDGGCLLVGLDNRLARLDAATGRELVKTEGHGGSVWRLFFSPNGKRLITTSDDPATRVLEWDLTSGRPIRTLPGKVTWARLTAMSPERRLLVSTGSGALRLWDTSTGNEVRQIRLPLKNDSESPEDLLFAPDGKLLAAADAHGETVWLVDSTTGKLVCTVEGIGRSGGIVGLAFSADGGLLAAASGRALDVALVPSGRRLRHMELPKDHQTAAFALSPDGRTLAAQCSTFFQGATMRLWETASGKERLVLPAPPSQLKCVAFSPDGRLLAAGGMDRSVVVWDVVARKQVARLEGHQGEIASVAFSPDGKRLASVSEDTTVLIWDVTRLSETPRRPAAPTPKELEALWSDLAGADAGQAYRAILNLEASPEEAVPLLAEHLRARPAGNAGRIERVLAGLESKRFAEREAATDEVRRLGWAAEDALCRMLAGKPSLEARKRAEELLVELQRKELPPELLRIVRGLEVLEHVGTPEAKQGLQRLAGGVPGTLVTREARASRDRVAGRHTRPAGEPPPR